MDKQRLAWIVLLVAGVVMAGLWILKKKSTEERLPKAPPSGAQVQGPTTAPAGAAASRPAASRPTASAPASSPAGGKWQQLTYDDRTPRRIAAGSLDPKSGYLLGVTFDRRGASLYTVQLANTFATVADKQLYHRVGQDHAKYLAAVAADKTGTYQGHYPLLNPVGRYLSYATRSLVVGAVEGGETTTIPLDGLQWDLQARRAVTQPAEGEELTFVAVLARNPDPAAPKPSLRLTKTYRVVKNDHSLQMSLKVENLTGSPLMFYVEQLGPTGLPREELFRGDYRHAVCGKLQTKDESVQVVQQDRSVLTATDDGLYRLPSGQVQALGRSDDAEPALWLAGTNKFFASVMYLYPAADQRLQAPGWLAEFGYLAAEESPTSRTFVPTVRVGGKPAASGSGGAVPELLLQPGATKEMAFDLFAGPKKRDMFTSASAPHYKPLYEKLNYLGTLTFQSCFCAPQPLTIGMMWLLQNISRYVAFGNYGVAIMILVVLVRIVLHPLTKKSQVSMMKMQKLQPEMAKLKKKYADDKEALQRETMKFYKQQGASPFLGCLPMFLQMPIWISLWGSLNAAVELRHAAFLPVWITDLAGPDELIVWGGDFLLPLIGGMTGPIRSLNLLPLLLTVAMYLQTKFNPQMAQPTAAASPEQEKQKKMMQIMMPAMMLLFFYNAASGLTLYIMTSTFAGVAEQFIIRRHIEAKQAAEAAATTTVKVPGKGPRDGRPKKPKGPFFIKHS
ncbi:MAG TPA: YidC/Oxa1 family insertase periplasmic-domain containing protein [Phycisphaerae bacterium]|nr:YidC/Oxa1 family insertase periplasmic-domain containing protein [Phycisphaerae bacterium]